MIAHLNFFFSLASIATLYILEYHKRSNHINSNGVQQFYGNHGNHVNSNSQYWPPSASTSVPPANAIYTFSNQDKISDRGKFCCFLMNDDALAPF